MNGIWATIQKGAFWHLHTHVPCNSSPYIMCWIIVLRIVQCGTQNNEWEAQGTFTDRLKVLPAFFPSLIHPIYGYEDLSRSWHWGYRDIQERIPELKKFPKILTSIFVVSKKNRFQEVELLFNLWKSSTQSRISKPPASFLPVGQPQFLLLEMRVWNNFLLRQLLL